MFIPPTHDENVTNVYEQVTLLTKLKPLGILL